MFHFIQSGCETTYAQTNKKAPAVAAVAAERNEDFLQLEMLNVFITDRMERKEEKKNH